MAVYIIACPCATGAIETSPEYTSHLRLFRIAQTLTVPGMGEKRNWMA